MNDLTGCINCFTTLRKLYAHWDVCPKRYTHAYDRCSIFSCHPLCRDRTRGSLMSKRPLSARTDFRPPILFHPQDVHE